MRCVFLLFCGFFLSVCLPAQTLDASFGSGGKVATAIQQDNEGAAMAVQPADQKIIVAGMSGDGMVWSFCVARYLPDGTLDAGFASGGKMYIPFGTFTGPIRAIAVQPQDGKILLAGEVMPTEDTYLSTVIRLLPNGTMDPSFGNGGVVELPAPNDTRGLGVQSDGKIVVGGTYGLNYYVTRLTTTGQVDAQFGNGGSVSTLVTGGGVCAGLVITFSDEIVVSGTGGTKHAVTVCYTRNGAIDTHFGTNGIADVTVNGGKDPLKITTINYTSDGWFLLAGNYLPAVTNPKQEYLVIRLRDNGILDPGFAGNGKLGIPFTNTNWDAFATGVAQDPSSRVIVGGTIVSSADHFKFAMCRITPQGVLDTRFGTDGWVTTSFTGGDAQENALVVQKDGKILESGAGPGGIVTCRHTNPITLPTIPTPIPATSGVADATASVAVDALDDAGASKVVRLFPNPASSQLRVSGLAAGSSTVLNVNDVSGRVLLTARSQGQDTYSLDIHSLTAGMYFLEVVTGTSRRSYSFIKTN